MKDHINHIILSNESDKSQLAIFWDQFKDMSIGDKIYTCQNLNENTDELSFGKTLLIYMFADTTYKNEIIRVFDWEHKQEKAIFLIKQLASNNPQILISSVELLGMLRQAFCIPELINILNINDPKTATSIIKTLGKMKESLSVKALKKALRSTHPKIITLAIKTMTTWVSEVSWKTFKPLIKHPDPQVRLETSFAIALRKDPFSVKTLLLAIEKEKDQDVRLAIIKNTGIIPARKTLMPLLKILTSDPSQKVRLITSRTLDRLQGILKPNDIFKLRFTKDNKIKAEVIYRLGKFGTDSETHRLFLHKTLMKSQDAQIIQSCLMALGNIADNRDVAVITEFLFKHPKYSYTSLIALTQALRENNSEEMSELVKAGLSSTYNAAMALTRTWRLEDKDKVLKSIVQKEFSATHKQIILKYLIRRQCLSIDPDIILSSVKNLIETENNMNARYLGLQLLNFAPTTKTLEFILSHFLNTKQSYEKEILAKCILYFCQNHEELILSLLKNANNEHTEILLQNIPTKLHLSFYIRLASTLFEKSNFIHTTGNKQLTDKLFKIFFTQTNVAKFFLTDLTKQNVQTQYFCLRLLLTKASTQLIQQIQDQIILFLEHQEPEIQSLATELLLPIKEKSIIPKLIRIAETNKDHNAGIMAKNLAITFIKECLNE